MPDLRSLFGEPDAIKNDKLSKLFGKPDAPLPNKGAGNGNNPASPSISIKGMSQDIPEGFILKDPSREEAEVLTPYVDALSKYPPGHPARVRLINEIVNINKTLSQRRKEAETTKGLRTPSKGEKAAAGLAEGFAGGVSLGHIELISQYYKNLERMATDPWLSKEGRSSAEAMAKLNTEQMKKMMDDPTFKIFKVVGELAGMAVPFTGLNRATAFIKLGKLAPNLGRVGQSFLKLGEAAAKEAAIGGLYGGAEKLEEGDSRGQKILEEAMLFGIFGAAFGVKGARQILDGSKNIDDFYKKIVNQVGKSEHNIRIRRDPLESKSGDMIWLRENYGSEKLPVRMEGQRFTLGNDFWYSAGTKNKLSKLFEEHQAMLKSRKGYEELVKNLSKEEVSSITLTRGRQAISSVLKTETSTRPAQEIADKLGVPRASTIKPTPAQRYAESQGTQPVKTGTPPPQRKPDIKFPEKGKQIFKKAWEVSGMEKGDVDENMRTISKAIEAQPGVTPQVFVKSSTGEIVTQPAFNHSDLIIKSGMDHSDVIDSGWKVGNDFYSYFYGKLPKQKAKDIRFPGKGRQELTSLSEPQMVQFISSNLAERSYLNKNLPMTVEEAQAQLKSTRHKANNIIFEDIDKKLGFKSEIVNGLGDTKTWGTENSSTTFMSGVRDFDDVVYSAAKKLQVSRQKAVIAFIEEKGGKDTYYSVSFKSKDDLSAVRKSLDDAGIEFRTIIEKNGDYNIMVLDVGSGLEENLLNFGEKYNSKITAINGRGKFIEGNTRTEAIRAAQKEVDWYESAYPDRKHYRKELFQRYSDRGSTPANQEITSYRYTPRGRVNKPVPLFTIKTKTPDATKVGLQFKGDERAILALEGRMNAFRSRWDAVMAEGKTLETLQKGQQYTHRAAMYREAWEIATGRMPAALEDIKPFFEKRKSFLASLDEMAARAEKRIKLRWSEDTLKFFSGIPIDPIRTVMDAGDLAIIGAQRIIRGANTFGKYSKQMIAEHGEWIRPQLERLYANSRKHVKSILKAAGDKAHKLPSLNKALSFYQKGEYAAEWYNKTWPEIKEFFGEKDGDMFLKFVGITSPQSTPQANVTKALELFNRWKLGQTSDGFMYGTKHQWQDFKNAIAGKPFGKLKINNFVKNLKGDLDAVTVDMWMFEIYFGKQTGTPIQYKFVEEDIKRLAKQLNRKPAEVQAAMWVGYKELPQNIGRGGEGSYNTIEHYVKQRFAASASKTPDAFLVDSIKDKMAKTGVSEAKFNLGSKDFAVKMFDAIAKDIRNKELGISANPYKYLEEFLQKNKLVLNENEKATVKAFALSLAKRKLLSSEQALREADDFIAREFGDRFAVIRDVRKATSKALEMTRAPETRPWYIRWLDGEALWNADTRRILRTAMGRRKRSSVNAETASEKRMEWFDKQSDQHNIQFMDQVEKGGRDISDPYLKQTARDYRMRLDQAWADSFVESAGKQAYIEDYFPHLWKDPAKAKKFFSNSYSGLYKNPGFLKQRYYQYIQDGLDAGLQLKTTNPELLVLERELAGFRYRETKNILGDLKSSGYLKFVKAGERAPDGWVRLNNSRTLEVLVPGAGKVGELYTPESARKVLDNYLSKGFWSIGETPFKEGRNKVLRGISRAKNAMVALKLGMSLFHFTETTTSSHSYLMGSALQSALPKSMGGGGDIRRAISQFGKWLPIYGDIVTQKKGHDIYSAWKTGVFKSDYERWAVEQIENAGGALSMPAQYKAGVANKWKEMLRNYRTHKPLTATAQLPLAIMEQMMKPLMEIYIPRLKAFNYISMVEDFAKRNPQIRQNSNEWVNGIQKLWDSVDNRFGQLQYDNLFFNRFARDIGVMSQISMGWNIGTFREFGGGVIDMTKVALGAALRHKPDVLMDRMLYSAMYTAHFATIGGLMTYLMSGEYPKQILDFFYPRTGNINRDGTAERVQMPTMLKEAASLPEALRKEGVMTSNPFMMVGGIGKGLWTYANHKVAPVFGMAYDLITNKDFYGTDISDPNAPIFQQMEQMGLWLAEQSLPITISSYQRHLRATGNKQVAGRKIPDEVVSYLAPAFGFSIAPGYVVKTRIQKEIFDLFQKRIPSTRTRPEWERYKQRAEVKELLWAGKPQEALKMFETLRKSGVVPKDTKWTTFKKSSMLPSDIKAFTSLPKSDQDYLWSQMSEEEKLKYGKFYYKKKKTAILP